MDAKVAHPDQLEEVQAVGHRGRRGIVVTTFSAKETTDTPHTPGYEIFANEINRSVNLLRCVLCAGFRRFRRLPLLVLSVGQCILNSRLTGTNVLTLLRDDKVNGRH